jgi:DGQHR domain-containing protein
MSSTIKTFENLTGKPLEKWCKAFFKKGLEFADYYSSARQISLADLDSSQSSGEHLEIDGVLLVGKTCVLIECTGQTGSSKDKVKKFARNCHIFLQSTLSLADKFNLLGVPSSRLSDFEEVEKWKFLFLGTATAFEDTKLKRQDFPEHQEVQRSLHIFTKTQIEYLVQLVNLMHGFAQNEFLANLEFTPQDLGDEETISLDYIKADGKLIVSGSSEKADVYLLKFKVQKLLKIARVSRYEGIPLALEESNTDHYQRLLIEEKLKGIAKGFIGRDARRTFPNTLTLVLSSECTERNNQLHIPKRYTSVDIIDGQHRLFAFTHPSIREEVRKNAEILASAIKFRTADPAIRSREAARLFCEINKNQAKVKNSLIYLIKYDVLGERTPDAIAGKTLLLCERSRGNLSNVFLTNALKKKNRFGMPPIPITTLVDSDLMPFVQGLCLNGNQCSASRYRSFFGESQAHYKRHPADFCKKFRAILDEYFGKVKSTFPHDWGENTNSALLSSKYIAGLVRLLRHQVFDQGKRLSDMGSILANLKTNVDHLSNPGPNNPSFPKSSAHIPEVKLGMNKIFNFLKSKC